MQNHDLVVLQRLRDWRAGGKRALLATVVRTWGSSPRPVGSIMALAEGGSVVGSVSGGCIEDDLIERYRSSAALEPRRPEFVKYGVSAEEAHRFGLPCGGTLELLLEFNPDTTSLVALVAAVEDGGLVSRAVCALDGGVTLHAAPRPRELQASHEVVVNTFGPGYRMLLIGAGMLTEYVAPLALSCGFAVTVCDPREEYASSWSVPGAQLVSGMPDDVVDDFKLDGHSCVLALTHDPKLDDLALLQALHTNAFYIGAIGSRRNNAARRSRMQEHFGETAENLARLKGPIGIYIGSKTPPEIAVSIMAEILAAKNAVVLPAGSDVGRAKTQLAHA